jgi:proteasome maturation protein
MKHHHGCWTVRRRRAGCRSTAATINHHRPSDPRHLLSYRLYRSLFISHSINDSLSFQRVNSHTHIQPSWFVTPPGASSTKQPSIQLTHSLRQSLRIVPHKGHAQQTALAPSAPSAPGVHDTLRSNQSLNTPHNASPAFSAVASSHPLEARLTNWRSTQDALKMTMLRREFGIAEPIRRAMEVKICQEGDWRPAVLGFKGEGVHEQILSGRDASVDWEDVFNGEFCCVEEEGI